MAYSCELLDDPDADQRLEEREELVLDPTGRHAVFLSHEAVNSAEGGATLKQPPRPARPSMKRHAVSAGRSQDKS